MKSLWKISRRYILTAVFITVFVIFVNLAVFIYMAYTSITEGENQNSGMTVRQNMEKISSRIHRQGEGYGLSQEGYDILKETSFQWAMLLDRDGKAVWEYALPKEIPRQFGIPDVASFSRWYLEDYPVYVWRHGDGLLVFGCSKGSIVRLSTIWDGTLMRNAKWNAGIFCILNLLLLLCLALAFGYRFYKALKPVAGGIEALSKKEKVEIPEKGMIDELAAKLNQASEILCLQNSKLELRDNARTDWIAGVSHDIRTPMTVILGYLEIMRLEAEGKDKMVAKVEQKARKVMELINQFFTLAKLESGDTQVEMGRVNLSECCRENVLDFYELLTQKEFQVEIEIPEEPVFVEGNEEALQRILFNLISNAVRYGSDGKYLGIAVRTEGVFALIHVTDRGKGIEKAFAGTVFERLFTMEDSRNREIQGNGLGLTIARNLAVKMGGDITLVSEPDVSTTFTVKLRKMTF